MGVTIRTSELIVRYPDDVATAARSGAAVTGATAMAGLTGTLVSVIGGLAFSMCFAGFYLHIQSRQTTQSDSVTGSLAEAEARHSKESGTD
jgi:hypothetical protein